MPLFARVLDNTVVEWGTYDWLKDRFPDVTFPNGGPGDGWLAEHHLYRVQHKPRPIPNGTRVMKTPEPYYENGFVLGYTLEPVNHKKTLTKDLGLRAKSWLGALLPGKT